MVASLAEAKNHNIDPDNFVKLHNRISEAKRNQEDASAALSAAKKLAKSGSVNLDAYGLLQKIRKLEDDEQVVVLRTLFRYMTYLGMEVGTQYSLLDAPKMAQPSPGAKDELMTFEAGEAGLKAGRSGEPSDNNPHAPGTSQHASYATRYKEGVRERATAAKMADTEGERPADTAEATRKAAQGRGRKSQSAQVAEAMEKARSHLGGATAH